MSLEVHGQLTCRIRCHTSSPEAAWVYLMIMELTAYARRDVLRCLEERDPQT